MTDQSIAFTTTLTAAVVVVMVTTPNEEVGRAIAKQLVAERIAACVSLVPAVHSVYRWEGSVHTDTEAQLLIKTRAALFSQLEQRIKALHPYKVPEIIALPVSAISASYAAWISAETIAVDQQAPQ